MTEVQNQSRDVPAQSSPQSPSAGATAIEVNDANVQANYANFCRISGTPEEVLIDFATTMQSQTDAGQPHHVAQRIITNWYTAKRLLQALHLSVQRHEMVFGELELNVEQRVRR